MSPMPAWPGLCAVCGRWSGQRVCADCTARFAPPVGRCGRCAIACPQPVCGACLRRPPAFDAAWAAVSYGYPWAGLLARCKFGGEAALARTLAALWPAALRQTLRSAATHVLPMPLAPLRLRGRGFNQAQRLARAAFGRAVDDSLLLRVRETPDQHALARGARLRNLQGAFAVEPALAHRLQGARVLLVDDVMTTGATLEAASAALKSAGAAEVVALGLARTE